MFVIIEKVLSLPMIYIGDNTRWSFGSRSSRRRETSFQRSHSSVQVAPTIKRTTCISSEKNLSIIIVYYLCCFKGISVLGS